MATAEDILQEAFLNASSSYSKFQDKSQISTWLYRILLNCAYKNMKKINRLPVYAIENNKMDMIPNIQTDKELDYYLLFRQEMNFLQKVAFLYEKYPERMSYEEFIEKMKNMISEKSLNILS